MIKKNAEHFSNFEQTKSVFALYMSAVWQFKFDNEKHASLDFFGCHSSYPIMAPEKNGLIRLIQILHIERRVRHHLFCKGSRCSRSAKSFLLRQR